jgi:hypothetical protein
MRTATLLIAVASLAATAGAEPPRNFLPLEGRAYTYWDAAGVSRDGDTVAFDEVRVDWDSDRENKPYLYAQRLHYRLDCGWLTWTREGPSIRHVLGEPGAPGGWAGSIATDTIGRSEPFARLILDLCSAPPLHQPAGLDSIDAAIRAGAGPVPDYLGAPVILAAPDHASPQPWMAPASPFAFSPVEAPSRDGSRLFLDRANLRREGDHVAGYSLVVRGLAARDPHGYAQTTVLRRVEIDCARGLETITAQAGWNRYGDLAQASEAPWPARDGRWSPLVAAEIQAACSSAPGAPVLAGVAAAEDWAHSGWRRPARSWSPDCVWRAVPAADRAAYVTAIVTEKRDADLGRRVGQAISAGLAICNVPAAELDGARSATLAVVRQQVALEVMRGENPVDEATLAAAIAAIDWRKVERLDRIAARFYATNAADQALQAEIAASIGARLGLSSERSLKAVGDYATAAAGLAEL